MAAVRRLSLLDWRLLLLLTSVLLSVLVQSSIALNILISNDDCWATANIHAIYYAAKKAGHAAVISAPVMQMSGTNGRTRNAKPLDKDGEFGFVKRGAPAEGHDRKDDYIWYVNTTPVSSVEYGLQVLSPRYFGGQLPDLVVAGTNQGYNVGLAYLASGTYGAAKYAILQGVPALAFSAGNEEIRPYTDLGDENDQANIYAASIMQLIYQLQQTQGHQQAILPRGVGLNVNFPNAANRTSTTGKDRWMQTRMLGTLDRNPDACVCGRTEDCKLPTEEQVVRGSDGITNTVSVFETRLFDPDAKPYLQHVIADRLAGFVSCP